MIEVRHLKLIAHIAESGSMTRAAERLFLTQPSLSHQLKEIEGRLGTRLFLRVNKKMVLTPAGSRVLRAAGEILPQISAVESDIKGLEKDLHELRVSTHCYTCYHWLPALVKDFRDSHPNFNIEIVTEAMSDPVGFLLDGKIDVAITNSKTTDKGIHFEKLFDDEHVLLVPQHHPLAGKEFVRPKDLEAENLIIYKEALASDYFSGRVLVPANVTPRKVTKMQLTEARVEMVKADLGVTVLSKWLVRPFLKGGSPIRQVKIGKNGFFRPWYAVMLKQKMMDPFVGKFAKHLTVAHQTKG